jgi:hypothetical protein
MPKRMRPYGSAVDAESAGRARGRRRGSDDHVSDLASAMTARDVAAAAASAVEALGELIAHAGLEDTREVIDSLERIGQELPHLCEQIARAVVVRREDGGLETAPGQDLDFWVGEVVEALASAGRAADMTAAALNQASSTCGQLRTSR